MDGGGPQVLLSVRIFLCRRSRAPFVIITGMENREGEEEREGGRKQKEMGGEKPSFRGVFSYSR